MPETLDPKEVGRRGEATAAEYLAGEGYLILDTNWRWSNGEIDIVAEQDGELIFVEVKTRRSHTFGMPEESITNQKRQKLIQTANAYLSRVGRQGSPWRIDVVAIDLGKDGAVERLDHYESAVEGS
jgi:putative endonuclease